MTKTTTEEGRLASSWETNAGRWTRAVRDGAIPSRRRGSDDAILSAVRDSGAGTVLDLGCGEGWLARALAAAGLAVTGVDGSASLIAAARDRASAGAGRAPGYLQLGYDAIAADPGACGGPFEAVIANFSLLGRDIGPLLAALRRILTEDGALLIQTPHPLADSEHYADGWREESFRPLLDHAVAAGEGAWTPMPWYFRTLETWVRLLSETGYRLHDLREPRPADAGPDGLPLPLSLLLWATPSQR